MSASLIRPRRGCSACGLFFLTVEGRAELVRDKGRFAAHWTKDLDRWFEQGVDTPGLVLIKVDAHHLHYWDGFEEGEVALRAMA